jgi:phage gpG-like protein
MSGSGDINTPDFSASGLGRMNARFASMSQGLHDRLLIMMADQAGEVATMARRRLAELFTNPARMQNAIESRVIDEGPDLIRAEIVASGLEYLAIHEYGGSWTVPEMVPVDAQALHFFDDHYASASRFHPTFAINEVFTRKTESHISVMPERSYMRYALAQRASAIRAAFAAAVKEPDI